MQKQSIESSPLKALSRREFLDRLSSQISFLQFRG